MTANESDESGNKLTPAPSFISGNPGVKEYLVGYFTTAKHLTLQPRQFFETMPQSGGLKEPSVYLGVSCAGYAILHGLLTFKLLGIISVALSTFVGTYVVAGVALLLSKAMGAKGDFESTFRVFAYISCLRLLLPIPVLGGLAWLYGLVLAYFGLRKIQALGPVKTGTIVFLTGFLAGLIIFLASLATHFNP